MTTLRPCPSPKPKSGRPFGVRRTTVARFTAAGVLDPSFGGSGTDRGMTFLRLLANGAPDTSFGTNGRTLVKVSTISNYDEPRALAL
ncbi:hypothetical protein, partial [Tahibacter sp.]|uniref:hypothetical protein n=1 Tax=Tahibacter sp. TaxID=2056211 RepID=UPI0039C8F674